MRGRRWAVAAVAAVAAGVAAATVTATVTTADERAAGVVQPLGPGDVTVRIGIHHTTFVPDHLSVVAGTRVRFVVDNGDPINHELITGGPAVHRRHARGTEGEHPAVPGEVSVGPNATAITTYSFDEPGTYEFACHLPGHHAYGMHGTIDVVPA